MLLVLLPWASCTCLRAHAVPSWHRPGLPAGLRPARPVQSRARAASWAVCAPLCGPSKRAPPHAPSARVPERLALRRRASRLLALRRCRAWGRALPAHRLGERRVPRAAHRGATTGEHIDDRTGEVGEPGYIEDEEPPLHAASPDPPLRPLASPDRPARSTGGPVRCRHASSRHELGGAAEASAGHGRC